VATSAWVKAGGILLENGGGVILCTSCPCEASSSGSSASGSSSSSGSSGSSSLDLVIVDGCEGCDSGLSKYWETVVAGVTNGNCSIWNGTWVLDIGTGGTCIASTTKTGGTVHHWHNALGTCRDDTFSRVLTFRKHVSLPIWHLRFGTINAQIDYEIGEDDFDCLGPNTMVKSTTVNLIEDNGCCSGWPATLTLEPIEAP